MNLREQKFLELNDTLNAQQREIKELERYYHLSSNPYWKKEFSDRLYNLYFGSYLVFLDLYRLYETEPTYLSEYLLDIFQKEIESFVALLNNFEAYFPVD